MDRRSGYPRKVTTWEKDLLHWVLPADRLGYRAYRKMVDQWDVVAEGRRGPGNYILAPLDERVDNESPLPQVLAYGVVETPRGDLSVTVRERVGNQIEFEIVNLGKGEMSGPQEELRRWTFSTWLPHQPCPICSTSLREVPMKTERGWPLMLAVCAEDRKLWIYNGESGVNHPIPVTNFYNELMLCKKVRDPVTALDPQRLFTELGRHADSDLAHAFRSYNQVRTKIPVENSIVVELRKPASILSRIVSVFKKT